MSFFIGCSFRLLSTKIYSKGLFKMSLFSKLIVIYLIAVAAVAVIITAADKLAAKKGAWRIPEATLMIIGLFGGALPMYVTMKTIRHKTKHKKFMIGLPLEIALHAVIACVLIFGKFNII